MSPELALSVMTVPDAPFEARVTAAAAAGFDGIGSEPDGGGPSRTYSGHPRRRAPQTT